MTDPINLYNSEFDPIIDRRSSDSTKWLKYDEDVLPMWVADMDFLSPEPVLRALRARIDHGIFGYPHSLDATPGQPSTFRLLLVERMQRLYRWQIQPDDIIFLPGVVTGFHLACHALGSPQNPVVIQTPVYHPILHAGQETGIAGLHSELLHQPDGTYDVDWDAFEAQISGQPVDGEAVRPGLFILCNPHNPVGKVFTPAELERTAAICLRHGVPIVSDEIHCDLIFSGHRHTPIASLDPEIAQNTITLMAPSKTFNIAGLQCSFAIVPNPALRKRYLNARKGLVPWVNLAGMLAGEAAYQHGQEWLDRLLVYLETNRNFLVDYVRQNLPGVQVAAPQGTYLAWLDFRQVENSELRADPYKFLLDCARLAVNDGASFGPGGQGFVRLNFGCPNLTLEEGLQRIRQAL